MRVILITHLFLPEFSGGTETLVHSIASNLIKKGHEAMVVTGYDDKSATNTEAEFDEYTYDGIRVVRFKRCQNAVGKSNNPISDDYDNRAFEIGFEKLIAEYQPHVVHFHHFGRLSIKAVDACTEAGIPAFLTATDYWAICPHQALLLPNGQICDGPVPGSANCLKHMVEVTQSKRISSMVNVAPNSALRLVMGTLKHLDVELPGMIGVTQSLAKRKDIIAGRFRSLAKIFVPTRHAQATLEKNGIVAKAFRVLPFGIKDYGYIKRARRRNGNLVVGFIGQFLPHKGLHVLMEALRLLPEGCPVSIKVYAKLPVSETQYVRDFLALVQHDPRVSYEGTFENDKIPAVLDKLDALVIPSIWHENMPLVSLSAQAAGCPLIASDVGGLSDVVAHGKNGLLFQPGSAEELRDCILQLVRDETMLYHLSNAAITPGSLTQYVDVLENEYMQAIGELKT